MTTHALTPTRSPHAARRPWTLWALGLIVALVGVSNLALAWDHARRAEEYRALGVSYPPELRAALALGWGVLLLALGLGLIQRRRWARRWILVVVSNYGAFGVLWLMGFAQSDYSRGRIVFQAALTAGLVLALAWIMRWRRIRAPFEHAPGHDAGTPSHVELSESESREK